MKCPKCGKKIQKKWKACPECGTDLSTYQDNSQKQSEKKKPSILKKIGTFFGIFLLLSLLLAMCGSEEPANEVNVTSNATVEATSEATSEAKTETEVPETEIAEITQELETEAVVPESEDDDSSIIKGKAQDNNDLTGTYVDSELGEQITLIQKDGLITYCYGVEDDSEPVIETECTINDGYISGNWYYISRNMDGSLAISSGAGGSWGSFKKVSDEAEINLALMENSWLTSEETDDLSYDLDTDIENGMLYGNSEGQITDMYGNAIPEYAHIFISPAGGLIDTKNNRILSGDFYISDDGKLAVGKKNSLLPDAYEMYCARGVIPNESGSYSYMEDDGSYFDEVILGAWFNDDGTPKAGGFPKQLDNTLTRAVGLVGLDKFKFIDGVQYTLDSIKRDPVGTNKSFPYIYAILLSDIEKVDTGMGIVYVGFEYVSYQPVIMHGNFDGILNGDDILMFGTYSGLSSDDIPNFQGYYVEIRGNGF